MKRLLPVTVMACVACSGTPAQMMDPPPDPPAKVSTTYRILSGVSMGATGAASLGLLHPEKFDGVAVLGGPLDAAYFFRMVDKFAMGGFCTLAELEAIAEADPAKLNDPDEIAKCSHREPPLQWEHSQDFNHWHYSMSGTSAQRDTYLNMFTDITLAHGSLGYENPESPFAPPGVDPLWAQQPPASACADPVRVKHFYNAEYNPTGKYDAITFCDGQPRLYYCKTSKRPVDFCSDVKNKANPLPTSQERAFAETFCATEGGAQEANNKADPQFFFDHAGKVDPCRLAIRPVTFGLALDINGNGRRDYGEPVLKNSTERFDDVGGDGCADPFETGNGGCGTTANPAAVDPNQDNYDVVSRPLGTENNWLRDEGEPYRDDGVDGVPGTHDFGEGNGSYDQVAGRRRMLSLDARTNFKKLTPAQQVRLNVFADGGIHDMFNLGMMSRHMFSMLKALRSTPVGEYRDFLEIPNMKDPRTGQFNPWGAGRWRNVPKDLITLYGKEEVTPEERINGEGDHVGTPEQAVNRFITMFNWAAATWPTLERPATPFGQPSGDRQKTEWFDSKSLGAKWEYSVALPPGYDAPENANARYPVAFLLHGYGMEPKSFMSTALITDSYATDPEVKFRPMIMVFPNGRCCWVNRATGGKDCRETNEDGSDFRPGPGFERECISGSFYVNRAGVTPGDDSKYGDAFFELMEHIDAKYRTLPTAEVDAR